MMIFLQSAANFSSYLIFGIISLLFMLLIPLVLYIYFSLAYMVIAKKTNYPHPGIAWIPFVGPSLITSKSAKMQWWPVLMLIIPAITLLILRLIAKEISLDIRWIIGLIIMIPISIYFIFFLIWHWKTFKSLNKPGWMGIIGPIIFYVGFSILYSVAFFSPSKYLKGVDIILFGPLLLFLLTSFLGTLIHSIILGIAAWSKN